MLAYAAAVLFWRDPVTDLYNRFQQNRLESALEAEFEAWDASAPPAEAEEEPTSEAEEPSTADVAASRARTASDARKFTRSLEQGQAFGRLELPSIGLGRTVGIAGHRTTFGAPFRHIDDIEVGDRITLEIPYGTFRYRVFKHEIVDSDDWSVIRDRGFDTLMLSACHPLYGASERWIVYARLVEVTPRQGEAYTLAAPG